MEQNTETSTSLLNRKVGNIEQQKNTLTPAQITIVGIVEKDEKPNGEKYKLPLIQVMCKHPEKEEPIAISKVKILTDDKVITKTLWAVLDDEDNIQKGSAIDDILKFADVDCLANLDGKKINTVVESKDSSFLCLKLFN